jgi:hypothetical protein
MYEIIYKLDGEKLGINYGNKTIPIDEKNRDYKKYLEDIEKGVEVIDNPPSQSDILKSQALNDLTQTDLKISRQLEDIYNVLSDTQKASLSAETKTLIADKVNKRNIYLDLL